MTLKLNYQYYIANLKPFMYVQIKLLVLDTNTCKHLKLWKQMNSGSYKRCYQQTIRLQIIHVNCMYKQGLALNNLQELICHTTQPANNQPAYVFVP